MGIVYTYTMSTRLDQTTSYLLASVQFRIEKPSVTCAEASNRNRFVAKTFDVLEDSRCLTNPWNTILAGMVLMSLP